MADRSKSAVIPTNGSISIIIPCYNEENRLGKIFKALQNFGQKWQGEKEFIFVNDGSSDNTLANLNKLADKSTYKDNIKVLDLEKNGGKGAALKKGVLEASGDWILTIDADNAVSPSQLFKWIKQYPEEVFQDNTIYIGSREMKESEVENTAFRRWAGLIFNGIIQFFTRINFKDTQCGFKLYPAQAAKYLFGSLRTKGWAHDVELLNRAIQNDINIVSLPVKWQNIEGSKIKIFSDSIKMFLQSAWIGLSGTWEHFVTNPIRKKSYGNDQHSIYRLLFAVVFVLAAVAMPILSSDYGITGDEQVQKVYGDKVLSYYESFGEDKSCLEYKNLYHYGAFFEVFTSFMSKHVLSSMDPYDVRHLFNALCGLLLFLFTAKLAYEVSSSWKIAFWTFLFCLLYPRIFGHSMNNPKDIPFACFFILGMIYIVKFYKEFPKVSIKTMIGFIIGFGLAFGIRVGAILLIPYLGLFGLVALIRVIRKNGFNMNYVKTALTKGLLMFGGGYVLGVLFWPYALQSPLKNPFVSYGEMANFSTGIRMLYNNAHQWSDNLPWFYLPHWILMASSLVVLIGLPLYLLRFFTSNSNKRNLYFLLLFAFLFPPAFAIISGASYYDGIRHFIFILPIMIVISALGWTALQERLGSKISLGVEAIMGGLCILPLLWMFKSHPNQYIYFNELFGGASNNYSYNETDYWMNSMKETCEWFLENEYPNVKDKAEVTVSTNAFVPVNHYLRIIPELRDKIKVKYTSYVNRNKVDSDYEIFFSRFVNKDILRNGYFPPSEMIYENRLGDAILSNVSKRINGSVEKQASDAIKANDFRKADSLLQIAYQGNKDDDELLEQMAFVYLQTGRNDQFEETIETISNYTTSDPIIAFYQGLYHMKKNDNESAKQWFEKTVNLNYKLSSANYYLANIYANEKDWQKAFDAIVEFERGNGNIAAAFDLGVRVAEQIGERAYASFFRAKKSAIEKDYNAVLQNLRQAVRLNPKLERAQDLLKAYEEALNKN